MKNKWHDEIRKRLKKYHKECLACLYPDDDYEWGCNKKSHIQNTLNMVNKIMRGIPVEAWPKLNDDMIRTTVADGNWSIKLGWEGKRKTADLKFRNNNHTAWVIESPKKDGTYIDFDIGGS